MAKNSEHKASGHPWLTHFSYHLEYSAASVEFFAAVTAAFRFPHKSAVSRIAFFAECTASRI